MLVEQARVKCLFEPEKRGDRLKGLVDVHDVRGLYQSSIWRKSETSR
jgi:hypothetical protein